MHACMCGWARVCALYLDSVVPDNSSRLVASTMPLQPCLRSRSFSKGKSLSLSSKWKVHCATSEPKHYVCMVYC